MARLPERKPPPPPRKTTTSEAVREQRKERANSIFENWNLLNAILDRHEGTIRKRWYKKSKEQRMKLLLSAWPQMPASHRPGFAAWHRELSKRLERGSESRDAYMWPHVNLEDLSEPKSLLLFLRSRARNSPDMFAIADGNAAFVGITAHAIQTVIMEGYTITFSRKQTANDYGELIARPSQEHVFNCVNLVPGVLEAGDGLLILEIQQRLMQFLVDCSKRIMHDISAERLTSEDYPSKTQPPLPVDTIEGFASRAIMAAEAPYHAPQDFDLERLESLVAAKVSSTEDHIWALREDPGYFGESVLLYKDHRMEFLKDKQGREHPHFTSCPDTFWSELLSSVIDDAYTTYELWKELHSQVEDLKQRRERCRNCVSLRRNLDEEYCSAIVRFSSQLQLIWLRLAYHLRRYGPSSPPLRTYFVRLRVGESSYFSNDVDMKGGLKAGAVETEFLWLFTILVGYEVGISDMGFTLAFDKLQRVISSHPVAKQIVSPLIAGILSDLSIVCESMEQVLLYTSTVQTMTALAAQQAEGVDKKIAEKVRVWSMLGDCMYDQSDALVRQLGDP